MKKLLTNEDAVKKLLKGKNLTSADLWCLIEVGSVTDDNNEEIVLTANHIFINPEDNAVYLKDKDYSDEAWKFSELSVPIQKDVVWTLRQTLAK